MDSHSNEPIQTLKLNDRDKARLVQAVDAQGAAAAKGNFENPSQRRNIRVGYKGPDVTITLLASGGTISGSGASFGVVARNLSRRGLAFIHGRFIHPHVEVQAQLPTLQGEPITVEGKIVRCRHIGGVVHEVSIKFDQPINLDDHLTLSPEQAQRHDEERAADLADHPLQSSQPQPGTVLIVNDYAADRKLLSHHLSNMDLNVIEAVSSEAGLSQLAKRNFDLAIIELNLRGQDGLSLMRQFRGSGFVGPMIASGSVSASQVQAKAEQAGADDFLAKPFDGDKLRTVIEDLLGRDNADDGPLYSTYAHDQNLRPLLREFIAGLNYSVQSLREAEQADNHEQLQITCHQLKGAGSGYGFEPITQTAQLVLDEFDAEQAQMDQVHTRVQELIQLLRRVQFK